jgi:hypothetical protein
MAMDERLISDRFPRASGYHPEWLLAGVSGAANPLWMTEWLAEALSLKSGMRVLDLGCGRAMSSILCREFGVEVWATDLWFSASENLARIRDAGVADRASQFTPTRANCHSLRSLLMPLFPLTRTSITALTTCTSIMWRGSSSPAD